MLLSLLALLVILTPVLLLSRGCSFDPGAPTADPATAPTADLAADLPRTARSLDFPLRLPAVPEGWRANSSSTSAVPPAAVAVRAGWLTPHRFVQLSQSAAPAPDLVRAETGREPEPAGEVEVDGTKWTVYPGRRAEAAWLADLGEVRLLITGDGDDGEFRALARAAAAAAPLPRA